MRWTFGKFLLDTEARQLHRGGKEVHLQPTTFRLLCTLVEARPRALSKDELMKTLWPGVYVNESNLSMLVNELRNALGDDPQTHRFIRTLQRFGYAFVAEARKESSVSIVHTSVSDHWLIWGRQWVELPQGEAVVGSHPQCEVHLDLPGVSSRHARLTVAATRVTLEDLGSRTGTSKQDESVTEAVELQDGDRLRFGPVVAYYRRWPDFASRS